jgi:nitrate/TMAO reductase-like tetraheme cytochrome c subunit
MKKVLLLFLMLSVAAIGKGQPNSNIPKVLNTQAEEMGKLLMAKKFKEFVKYTHPKVIEMIGGEQKMVLTLENGFKDLDKQGVKFLSVEIGEPSGIIRAQNELQAIVPQKIKMQLAKKVIVSESSLIAFSFNSGKDWKFVDANGKTNREVKSMFPTLSEKLIIPAKKEYELK